MEAKMLDTLFPDVRLSRKGITTCKEFLSADILELMNILDVTYPRLKEILSLVSRQCAPKCISALDMYRGATGDHHGNKSLPTGLKRLDALLKGGLPAKTITEISGPPGSGKTQMCLTLSAATALSRVSNSNHAVLYIDTEGAFSAERLLEVLVHQVATCSSGQSSQTSSTQQTALAAMSHIYVLSKMTCDKFLECLDSLQGTLRNSEVGVVIVDSVASLARKEFDLSGGRGIMDRTAFLLHVSAKLKYLAEIFNLQVIVTNQIYATPTLDAQGNSGGVVTPALGNAWYHSVNTRLLLEFIGGGTRKLLVDKSPVCGRESVLIYITSEGVTDHSDEAGSNMTDFPFEFPGHWQ